MIFDIKVHIIQFKFVCQCLSSQKLLVNLGIFFKIKWNLLFSDKSVSKSFVIKKKNLSLLQSHFQIVSSFKLVFLQ